MNLRKIFAWSLGAALIALVCGCGDNNLLSSSKDNNSDLWSFNMVPSGYQKAASQEDLIDVAEVKTVIQFIDQQLATTDNSDSFNKLNLNNVNNTETEYDKLLQELRTELAKCQSETTTDQYRGTRKVLYSFTPNTECQLLFSGGKKVTAGSVGPENTNAPTMSETAESFTVIPVDNYKGSLVRLTYSAFQQTFTLPQKTNQRGKTAKTEASNIVTGTIELKSGTFVNFGIKSASATYSTKVTDNRTSKDETQDYRAGFEINGKTTHVQKYSQKLANTNKPTEFYKINGIEQEKK